MNKHYTRVKGVKEDDSYYVAIVEGQADQVQEELIQCMGIHADSIEEYEEELMMIGFDIIKGYKDADALPLVSIPINLLNNETLF